MAASARTFVCVGLADAPITWGAQHVEVVLLVSVSADPDEDLHDLYDALIKLASDETALKRLLAERRYSTLLELLERASGTDAIGDGQPERR